MIIGINEKVKPNQIADLIINEYANFVVKNLFTRNKQIKDEMFLNLID